MGINKINSSCAPKDNPFSPVWNRCFGTPGGIPFSELEGSGKEDPNDVRPPAFRDKDNYLLLVRRGEHSRYSVGSSCPLYGEEFHIPFGPDDLLDWADNRLVDKEFTDVLEEFKQSNALVRSEKVWEYLAVFEMGPPGHIYEFLVKIDADTFVLVSTDISYPCFGRRMMWIGRNEAGLYFSRDDLFMYYVTPGAARRWAEARGMDEDTYQAFFGQ